MSPVREFGPVDDQRRPAIGKGNSDLRIRFDHPGPEAGQVEVAIKGHHLDELHVLGMEVVPEAGNGRLIGVCAAAFVVAPLEYPDFQAGAREIGAEAQTVVARPDNYRVIRCVWHAALLMVALRGELHQPMNPKWKKKIADPRGDFQAAAEMLDQRIAAALQQLGQRLVRTRDSGVERPGAAVANRDQIAPKIHRHRSIVISRGQSEAATQTRRAYAPPRRISELLLEELLYDRGEPAGRVVIEPHRDVCDSGHFHQRSTCLSCAIISSALYAGAKVTNPWG